MNLLTVLSLIVANGGITYSVRGRHIKQLGFAVSPYKHCETKHKTLTVRHIRSFIEKHRDLLSQPGHYLGAWEYEGEFYLDVSVVVSSQDKAAEVAKSAQQIAYFCLSTGRTIETV